MTVPAHGIFSTGDRYLTERQMRLSADYVDGPFTYDRIDSIGHWMQISDPETVSALVLKQLRRGGAGAALTRLGKKRHM